MRTKYIVDGNNLCYLNGNGNGNGNGKISILSLLAILTSILQNGDDFFCIFDATISHKLKNNEKESEADSIEYLLDKFSDKFYRVAGGTRADGVILGKATIENARVMSNDLFRDYQEKYNWIYAHSDRFVRWNLLPDGLLLSDRWPCNINIEKSAQASLDRLCDHIAHEKSSPNFTVTADENKRNDNNIKRDNLGCPIGSAGPSSGQTIQIKKKVKPEDLKRNTSEDIHLKKETEEIIFQKMDVEEGALREHDADKANIGSSDNKNENPKKDTEKLTNVLKKAGKVIKISVTAALFFISVIDR